MLSFRISRFPCSPFIFPGFQAAVRPEAMQVHEASSAVAAEFPSTGRRNLLAHG